MTPDQLELIKVKLRLLALEKLLSMIFRGLATSSSTSHQFTIDKLQDFRAGCQHMPLPKCPPEYADMFSREFREIVDELVSSLIRNIER